MTAHISGFSNYMRIARTHARAHTTIVNRSFSTRAFSAHVWFWPTFIAFEFMQNVTLHTAILIVVSHLFLWKNN